MEGGDLPREGDNDDDGYRDKGLKKYRGSCCGCGMHLRGTGGCDDGGQVHRDVSEVCLLIPHGGVVLTAIGHVPPASPPSLRTRKTNGFGRLASAFVLQVAWPEGLCWRGVPGHMVVQ